MNQLQHFIKHRDWVYTVDSIRGLKGLTRGIRAAVFVLLQKVTVPTAAAMASDPILTQLVTHAPQTTVIIICTEYRESWWQVTGLTEYEHLFVIANQTFTNAWAAVVSADQVSRRTGAGSSVRRGVTVILTAQRCTAPDTWHKTQPYSTRNVRKALEETENVQSVLAERQQQCLYQWGRLELLLLLSKTETTL